MALVLEHHQEVVKRAMLRGVQQPKKHATGLLAFYEVGTGKTLAALDAAKAYLEEKQHQAHVYVLTTLANKESTWGRDWTTSKRAISGDSAPYTRRVSWHTKNDLFSMTLKQPYMLVVDEAHLLRNAESQGYGELLPICQTAEFVLLLTATPMVRDIKDLNALYAYMTGDDDEIVDKHTAPADVGALFRKRILFKEQDRSRFPEVHTEERVVRVGDEYEVFFSQDKKLFNEIKRNLHLQHIKNEPWKKTIARVCVTGVTLKGLNPFLVNGRQVCNRTKYPELFQCLRQEPYTQVVVFSNFRDHGVMGFFESLCHQHKFRRSSKKEFECCVREEGLGRRVEVVIWHNDNFRAITKWQARRDQTVRVLLITPMAREGLSLKGVQRFHVLDPSWNKSDEDQAIGRAVRLTSHAHLPATEQVVRVTRWSAEYKPGCQTSDERVHELADEKEAAIAPFRKKLRAEGGKYVAKL